MKNWSIQTRVLFLALVPLTLIVLLISAHFVITRLQDLDRALQDRGHAIARGLAPACEYGVVAGNRSILLALATAALAEPDVVSVTVIDASGTVLTQVAGKQRTDKAPASGGRYLFRAPVYQSTVAFDDLQTAEFSSSGRQPQRQMGEVSVELSTEATQQQQARVLVNSLLIIIVGLGVTAIFAQRMAATVIRPVRELTSAVERIRDGDLDSRVSQQSGGELGRLEAGINAMAGALGLAREQEKRRAEDALYLETVRAQVTLESIGDGVVTTDAEGRVVYMNSVAEQFTGWSYDMARGRALPEIFQLWDEGAGGPSEYPIHECLDKGNSVRHDGRHLLLSRDGVRLEIQDSAAPIRDRDGSIIGAVVVFHDISQLQGMARRMAFLASHDPLTGLLNRREFEERLREALESARTQGLEHALLYLDLDQFKIVNDTCGHIAGDELLKQLAHHLAREIRSSDMLARLGGDEFGIVLECCSVDRARRVADSLRRLIKDFRFAWQNRSFEIGVSIGLVPIGADAGKLTDVLAAADSACYVAKDEGRNRIHVYQPDDSALAQRQGEMQWVHRLRHGLETNSFELYCQAIVPVAPGNPDQARFYEVLVRMREQELVLPTAFIPAAERYHLMPAIDRRVIESVFGLLRRCALRHGDAMPIDRVAINLSGQSLGDENFNEFVTECFLDHRVSPTMICFEITETAAIANLSHARDFIVRMKKMGCQFALDDFGSGLSSFGYLKSLPVDYLKIAGDFVRDIVDDPVDHAMVEAINQIGHVMHLTTIAESVETPEVFARLRASGVDYCQGLGIDVPRPFHEILKLPEAEWRAPSLS
ncbi:MAG TPA: EAL domain-containing protein, partial [Burkholderiales bacterium]|nr:EAL domain-containing protein [Burkholderiales bacterium]